MELEVAVGWIGAISASAGAVIGGGVTLLANVQTNRAAKKQREQERQHAVTDRQFDSQVAFFNAANELIETMRQHWGSLLADADEVTREVTKTKYIDAWQTYFASTSAARLAGPAGLEESAARFREAVLNYSKCLDDWDNERSAVSELKSNDEWQAKLTSLNERVTAEKNTYVENGVKLLSA